jgi:hypothetical protein
MLGRSALEDEKVECYSNSTLEIHTDNDEVVSMRTFVKGEKELLILQKAIEESNHMLMIQLRLKPKELLSL